MSTNPALAPDAWDEDWEKAADRPEGEVEPSPRPKKKTTRGTQAQRRAAHAEFNRQLWTEAESEQTFHFLEAKSAVPLRQEFKPAVKVLSRRPQIASRQAPPAEADSAITGLSRLSFSPDERDSFESDEDGNKAPALTLEERQAKALRDLEEKQRKYDEVRERLFGIPSNPVSGASSPGSTTPPSKQSQSAETRGKGRTRGGGLRDRDSREKRDTSSTLGVSRQLYDPACSAKPNSPDLQKRDRQQQQQGAEQLETEQQALRQPVRSPRGPDGSGRGGFGFSNRGKGA